jgi:hypothetical protein
MKDLFMVSDSKRIQMYFGYPSFMTCPKPIMRYAPVDFTPALERALEECGGYCASGRCQRNYYSPFE